MKGRLSSVVHAIAAHANLAPTVHNTQPITWHADGDTLWLLADRARFLVAADPDERDAGYSAGTALEGTLLALGAQQLSIRTVEELHGANIESPVKTLLPMARIDLQGGVGANDPLEQWVIARHTCRGGFLPVANKHKDELAKIVDARTDVSLIADDIGIERLARLNDQASLRFMRHGAYRGELLDWMRLTAQHPQWQRDGLAHDALAMSALEARAASVVLGTRLFEWVDRLGVAGALVSERKATLTSSAVLCLHRPCDESPMASGRALYRLWLKLTGAGLVAWPMAAVADDATSAAELVEWQGLDATRRYTAVLRIGLAPQNFSPRRVRRPTRELVSLR